jgi:hypothetical protein
MVVHPSLQAAAEASTVSYFHWSHLFAQSETPPSAVEVTFTIASIAPQLAIKVVLRPME